MRTRTVQLVDERKALKKQSIVRLRTKGLHRKRMHFVDSAGADRSPRFHSCVHDLRSLPGCRVGSAMRSLEDRNDAHRGLTLRALQFTPR